MKKEDLRTIGMIAVFVGLALLIICFDDIRSMVSGMMLERPDHMIDQLLR